MKYFYTLISIALLSLTQTSFAQCVINAVPLVDTINCGDTAHVSLSGFANYALDNDFNLGSAGAGWQATSSAQYDNPYIPSLTNDTYLWMGDQADVPRELTTNAFDLSFGGQICFDLVMSVQGNASPVEGPDQPEEGISLQYSTDGGVTWVDIAYFMPNGTSVDPSGNGWGPGIWQSNPGAGSGEPGANGQTPFTSWATYCFPIPAGAQTASSQIQWSQIFSSTANFDHWGLDNVQIFLADPSYAFFDLSAPFPISTSPVAVTGISSDTSIVYYYTNAINDTCYDTAQIYLNPIDAGPDILVSCDGIGQQLNATGVSPWTSFNWSPSAGLSATDIVDPYVNPTQDTEYILTTQCGSDTMNVFVEDSFSISFNTLDTICANGSDDIILTTSPASVSIASVEWNNIGSLNDSVGNIVTASPFVTTQYVATVTSDSGCVIQDSVILNVQGFGLPIEVTPTYPSVCLGESVDLVAAIQSDLESYYIVNTPYSPMSTTTGTSITNMTNNAVLGPLNLGFNMSFFGSTYNEIYLSSEGFISFDAITNAYSFNSAIPNTNLPNNIIAWMWDDLDFSSGGTITYYTGGTSPNQYMVINFLNVPHSFSAGSTVSVQVILYEDGTIVFNNIDVQSDGTFATMTQGIENSTGSEGYAVDSLNNTDINVVGLSFTYVPINPPVNPTFSWSPADYLNTTTGTSVTSTPDGDIEYTVSMVDGFCTTNATVLVNVDTITIDSLIDDIALTCPDDSIQLYGSATTTTFNNLDCSAIIGTCSSPQFNDVTLATTGTSSSSGTGDTPFGYFYRNNKRYIIYTAAELNSMGFFGGNLYSIAFNVTDKATSVNYPFVNIGLKCTSEVEVPDVQTLGFVESGFTNVYSNASYATTLGWNEFTFDNPYMWDGVSNLMVEFCFGEGSGTWYSNDDVELITTTNQEYAYGYQDGTVAGCTETNFGSDALLNTKPNIQATFCNVTPGFAPVTYQWSSNPSYTFDNDTIQNALIIDEVSTLTTVYLEASDGVCSTIDSLEIDFSGGLTLTPDTAICEGDTLQLSAVGGTNPVWTPNDNTISDASISNPTVYPTNTTTYSVQVDLTNCTVEGEVTVVVNSVDAPLINNGATQVGTCLDEPLTLLTNADTTNTLEWTGPETGTGPQITVNTSGVYTLSVTNSTGCVRTSDILVNIANPATLNTDLVRNVMCCNDSIVIDFDNIVNNSIPLSEVYINGNVNALPNTITLLSGQEGTYSIRSVDINGCESIAELVIESACNEGEIIDVDTLISNEQHNYELENSLANTQTVWSPSNRFNGNIFSSDQVGENTISVELIDEFVLNNGDSLVCIESDSSTVYIVEITNPEMPDAFTPNGDGINDVFFPVYLDSKSTIETFKVYNRWGDEVYTYSNDNGWDGTYENEDQPIDVYNYYIVIDKVTEQFILSGTVSLFR